MGNRSKAAPLMVSSLRASPCYALEEGRKWLPVSLHSLCTEAWWSSRLPAPRCVDADEWKRFVLSVCEVQVPREWRNGVYERMPTKLAGLLPVLFLISDSTVPLKEKTGRQLPPINIRKADEQISNSNTPAVALLMTRRAVIQGVGHGNALSSQPRCPPLSLRSHSSETL